MTAVVPLVTMQEARRALNWHPDRDAELQSLVLEVSSQWESLSDRLWGYRENYEWTTELPWDEKIINLPLYPLTALTVVSWADGETEPSLDDADEVLVLDTDYSVLLNSGEFTSLRSTNRDWFFRDWGGPDQYFKFRMTGGYTAATLLNHTNGYTIRRALLEQIKYQVQRNTPDRVANTNVAVGEGSAGLRSSLYHPQFQATAKMFSNTMAY